MKCSLLLACACIALTTIACEKDEAITPEVVEETPANFELAEALDGYYRTTSFEVDGTEMMFGAEKQYTSATWEFDYESDNAGTMKWIMNGEYSDASATYYYLDVVEGDYTIGADARTLTFRGTWTYSSGGYEDSEAYRQEFDVEFMDSGELKIVGTLDSEERVVIYAERE